ncbi:MAG: YqgE/AlgH family protein, partial [Verrucomicrobiota bacterium]|nr:YqgE/AlgH family protein [Verrucomicrobiota bacterium]
MADLPRQESPIRLQGQLLIADPTLREGIFPHSVILLTEHNAEEGAYGLILNHPSDHKVGEFLKDEEF